MPNPDISNRITYQKDPGILRVERQKFSMTFVLEMLHRQRGYNEPFPANDAWALAVDGVIVINLIWAATGLWM
jgi:hypothetical protein